MRSRAPLSQRYAGCPDVARQVASHEAQLHGKGWELLGQREGVLSLRSFRNGERVPFAPALRPVFEGDRLGVKVLVTDFPLEIERTDPERYWADRYFGRLRVHAHLHHRLRGREVRRLDVSVPLPDLDGEPVGAVVFDL